jgi:serine/threonine protein kinase
LENILITEKKNLKNLKICDFGLAGEGIQFEKRSSFKPNYAHPTVYQQKPFNGRDADLWSVGVVLFILLTNVPPYDTPVPKDPGFQHLIHGRLDKLLHDCGFHYDKHTDDLLDLAQSLLNTSQKSFSTRQALNHAWFQS